MLINFVYFRLQADVLIMAAKSKQAVQNGSPKVSMEVEIRQRLPTFQGTRCKLCLKVCDYYLPGWPHVLLENPIIIFTIDV